MTVNGVGGEIDDDDVRTLMYNTFADPKAKKKTYRRTGEWCGGIPALQKATEGYLEDYNAVSPKPMKLVLFLFAIEHVCRIARVLQMPRGNVLLAGVGGSGRQSVTRLASHICDMEVFQIEVSKSYSMVDWREDLKKVLREAGNSNAPNPTPHTPYPPLRCCARRGRRRRRRSSSSPTRRSSRRRTSRTSTACSTPARCRISSRRTRRRRSATRCAAARARGGRRGRRLADDALRVLCRPVPAVPAHLPRDVADRRGVPHAAAHVPRARQLLLDRLVPRVAARRARRGRVDLPRGGGDGEAQPAVDGRDVQDLPRGRALAPVQVPRAGEAERVCDADVVPRADPDLPDAARGAQAQGDRRQQFGAIL